MDRWNKLSMRDKSDLIKMYVDNGVYNLNIIKNHYNKFDNGGNTNEDNSDKVTNLILKAANTVLSSKLVPKNKKERLLELAMRLSEGNTNPEVIQEIAEYLKTKDGINTIKETVLSNKPVTEIVSKSESGDNYTGFAFSNDFLDADVESFIEEHPNDADFVEAYAKGVIPFESAGVFKVDDNDSTRFGRYKSYLDTNYEGRYIPTYQGHADTVSMDIVSDLNKRSYNKETYTKGVDSDLDLPFEFGYTGGTPGYYDAAGYNLELAVGKNGKLYGRKSDVYDFLPEDFIKKWTEEDTPINDLVKTVDKLGNPYIFRSPWFEVNNNVIPDELLEGYHNNYSGGGPTNKASGEKVYNVFEDEKSYSSRDTHKKSLQKFISSNPVLYGINTADFVDFFSELSGLEGTYNPKAGAGMPYSGYYGLKNGRNYSEDEQHRRAFKHLSEIFSDKMVKEDLQKGIEKGYTPSQILAKYWNQGNRVSNYLYNGVDDTDGVGTRISEYGWNMKSNIDYSKYLKDAIKDDFVIVKNIKTLPDAINRVRNKEIDISNRKKAIIDLNTEVKKYNTKNKNAVFDPLKLQIGDTIWLNRPKYLKK